MGMVRLLVLLVLSRPYNIEIYGKCMENIRRPRLRKGEREKEKDFLATSATTTTIF